MRILVADDDAPLREQLQRILTGQHYIVVTARDGQEALDSLFGAPFDGIILDVMMPKISGLKVLEEARKGGIDTPVLILTAKGDINDRVKGLDLGADDYLAKPFSMDELLARVRALLRRSGNQSESVLHIQNLKLDTVSRSVTVGEELINLTPKEFSILEFLLHHQNRVITRFNLTEHVWGDDFDLFSMSNFLDVHIKNLRHKIHDTGAVKIIQTIRGIGYKIGDIEL